MIATNAGQTFADRTAMDRKGISGKTRMSLRRVNACSANPVHALSKSAVLSGSWQTVILMSDSSERFICSGAPVVRRARQWLPCRRVVADQPYGIDRDLGLKFSIAIFVTIGCDPCIALFCNMQRKIWKAQPSRSNSARLLQPQDKVAGWAACLSRD